MIICKKTITIFLRSRKMSSAKEADVSKLDNPAW